MQVITLSNSLSDRVHSQTLDIKKKKNQNHILIKVQF